MEQKPRFTKFRNTEQLQFLEDVVSICLKADVGSLNIENQVNDLNQANQRLSSSFKQTQSSEFTLTLSDLDNLRDNDIKTMRKVSDAYTEHFDEAKAKAARLVLRTIDKYGESIYRMNYQAETTVLKNICNDLQEQKAVEAIELLSLSDIVAHLTNTNEQFNTQYLNRVEEKADYNDQVKTAELLKDALNKYKILDEFINAYKVINPSDALSTLINNLEELIDGYNNTVAQRSKKTEPEELSE